MSAIMGTGYGSAHDWQRGDTDFTRTTHYTCRVCGVHFAHAYNVIPEIFEAMARQGIPEACAAPGETAP